MSAETSASAASEPLAGAVPGAAEEAGGRPTPPLPPVGTTILEVRDIGKSYGAVNALTGVSTVVAAGQVTCVLGDNGAGKSTFIKMLAGVHAPSEGTMLLDGEPVTLGSPRAALQAGIATVYQDLAVVPLMPVWRNFFLGSEITKGKGPFRRLDVAAMKAITHEQLAQMGIDLRDVDQPIGTLSGGERQCVAIARAVHFGARVLILDEPTAALGVKQSGVVLRYIARSRDRGLGVVFITHNPHHAFPVGDRFLLLNRGSSLGTFEKDEITLGKLTSLMAGGAELDSLAHELARDPGSAPDAGQEGAAPAAGR
ncbi:sugar ABC transporter ATP-binding protein [Clavibacter nebraskensis]|uniref:ATP-binding cassette domain-containing protein n=1 Tax=Clavibacter nebraskensis TaxID=31963 RepID=A0A399Q897_9MICO|nr:ATP-binding cassette domain-containing protein [Clavibacter nebraskensis]KXU21468.1 sugar ABC transporter ATP-binding protein [Clavibacter nebraskensis]OAH19223.1 sugar ABC transporter ATP-binding protein [Clavibacter nebraskensis]QGV68806.1 sugar ABC transporter ATP-binding protein [Clavibacter nebraskensis]QGV71596.1 sugar ABC transporter ATP-binding protein [Clavibacter nebraskensis]RIJ15203.1 sugar ABC transporter ATP-binding protein [Clavibacter nebraskensis]